ncbi:class I SAM-dependent methyltransferase [Antrihabitans sp. YC3-6]|uniref:Class I SAM-dependent methyltransferase n=1 Tax=Antrihabitans stalagmiti TaxID=2799499 RepID=A0A934NT33_9NOCA|nr:class I SAM-dependent methyltransferase [Antrihabitans stalagmiti]MBJ8340808.1 class I SAM-dependent methyltransferase [Antrihabitans stalagmiti]
MSRSENVDVEQAFDRKARQFDRQMALFERYVLGRARQWAVAHARGQVVDLGVGTGMNLLHYGPLVEHVIGVDLSDGMLDIARRRVTDQQLASVDLLKGDVQSLELPDASVDTVVSTYTFCVIPDPSKASAEAFRVLRSGGLFVLAEHGPSTNPVVAWLMRRIDSVRLRFDTDHLTRDPVPFLREAGFVLEHVQRAGLGGITFRVLARKPTDVEG